MACRILAARGLVDGALGHVSARASETELVVRCRGPLEMGLAHTTPADIWRVTLDGEPIDVPSDYAVPNELPIHVELMRARPEVGAVVHAHPPAALMAGLAGLRPRAVFGAYNIPALRLALAGVPTYERPVLISTAELGRELVAAMGDSDACVMRGHGIATVGASVEQATVLATVLEVLLGITVELARLGAEPPELNDCDLAELPDLGATFNDEMTWRTLVADVSEHSHDAIRHTVRTYLP